MNTTLALRALTLLAFVVASTSVIVHPELIGGVAAAKVQTLNSVVALGHF
jgi:hypothetical protein